MQACKELDFMLFWDPEEEVFYLEKVNRFVHLRHNRQGVKRKSTHPSDYKTVVAPLKQNPSNPRNYVPFHLTVCAFYSTDYNFTFLLLIRTLKNLLVLKNLSSLMINLLDMIQIQRTRMQRLLKFHLP